MMKSKGKGVREISRILRRSPGTVSKWFNNYKYPRKRVWFRLSACKRARYVYEQMGARRHIVRRTPIRDVRVRDYVIEQIADWESPETISATMEDAIGTRVCFKTIYNLTKYERGLKKYLYEKGKQRRQKVVSRRGKFKKAAPKKRSIHTRNKEANERLEIGHLEADLMITKRGGSCAILSLIDRRLRRKWFCKIHDTKAKTVQAYIRAVLVQLPPDQRKTLSLDNGAEFAYSEIIKLEKWFPGLKVYYCDPYKSYQKGAIERANRDFRRYYPKGTDFADVSKFEVKRVQRILNNKRLKCLEYKTPMQMLQLAA